MMSLLKIVDLPELGDTRGGLVSIEAMKTLPFEIKRVYYIYNTENGVSRGFHAHKQLSQLAICISGTCIIHLDDGVLQERVILDSPSKGLIIEDMTWREIHNFSEDCILLVLASEHYDEADYIRSYDDFISMVKK